MKDASNKHEGGDGWYAARHNNGEAVVIYKHKGTFMPHKGSSIEYRDVNKYYVDVAKTPLQLDLQLRPIDSLRETGFYWIKYYEDSVPQVAHWCHEKFRWTIVGCNLYYDYDEFYHICDSKIHSNI